MKIGPNAPKVWERIAALAAAGLIVGIRFTTPAPVSVFVRTMVALSAMSIAGMLMDEQHMSERRRRRWLLVGFLLSASTVFPDP